jgi:hypothetical protein
MRFALTRVFFVASAGAPKVFLRQRLRTSGIARARAHETGYSCLPETDSHDTVNPCPRSIGSRQSMSLPAVPVGEHTL